MDRVDKIFTILVTLGLVGVLVHAHRPRGLGNVRVNTPALPKMYDRGPAYLLSALPQHRVSDEYADPVSYYFNGGTAEQPLAYGQSPS